MIKLEIPNCLFFSQLKYDLLNSSYPSIGSFRMVLASIKHWRISNYWTKIGIERPPQ
jgi:hypothetical protein